MTGKRSPASLLPKRPAPRAARLTRVVPVLMLLCAWSGVRAQEWPFELWHEGKIVLLEGDTLRGLVKYDLQQDVLQYNGASGQKVVAYSARKVLFFEIFDNTVHRYRQFFALPFNTPAGYKSAVFFELLEEGKMTLLAREALEYRTYNNPYSYYASSRLVLVYKYFFMDDNGKIEEFTGDKRDLLDLMGKNADDVEKYIKTNRLKVDEKYDFAKIIAYYNSLYGT
ncbi:hypothetical protein [Dawidia soli]|uniref:Uncharacterized protein n=1 Tax=Dawidia soli TaxID=2782352 RepID=A0AAP2D881_9BACT|nr:hypothetical protein [Dawidia soli]MBT1687271.1 hypothetical protein [Dawidia soli]